MDTLKALLDRYGVAVPVEATEVGRYANSDLQALYDQLVTQGMQSVTEALKVGEVIEETDIKDLDTAPTKPWQMWPQCSLSSNRPVSIISQLSTAI